MSLTDRFSRGQGTSTAASLAFGKESSQALKSAGIGGLAGLNPISAIGGGLISGLASVFAGRQLNQGLKNYNQSLEEDQDLREAEIKT